MPISVVGSFSSNAAPLVVRMYGISAKRRHCLIAAAQRVPNTAWCRPGRISPAICRSHHEERGNAALADRHREAASDIIDKEFAACPLRDERMLVALRELPRERLVREGLCEFDDEGWPLPPTRGADLNRLTVCDRVARQPERRFDTEASQCQDRQGRGSDRSQQHGLVLGGAVGRDHTVSS